MTLIRTIVPPTAAILVAGSGFLVANRCFDLWAYRPLDVFAVGMIIGVCACMVRDVLEAVT